MSYSFTAPPKDPSAVLDYEMDWSAWLATGETIIASPLPIVTSDAPETLSVSMVSVAGGNKVRFRLSGGSNGANHRVTVRVVTSIAQIDERTIQIPVREM